MDENALTQNVQSAKLATALLHPDRDQTIVY